MLIDVALVPQVAEPARPGVLIVIDQIRASTTITTLIDAGCRDVFLAGDPDAATATPGRSLPRPLNWRTREARSRSCARGARGSSSWTTPLPRA
jgi:phosphosulfolactate phosphohydrolase-like enzyme